LVIDFVFVQSFSIGGGYLKDDFTKIKASPGNDKIGMNYRETAVFSIKIRYDSVFDKESDHNDVKHLDRQRRWLKNGGYQSKRNFVSCSPKVLPQKLMITFRN